MRLGAGRYQDQRFDGGLWGCCTHTLRGWDHQESQVGARCTSDATRRYGPRHGTTVLSFFFWDSQHIMFLTILSHFFFLKLYLTTLTSRRHVSIMINTAERERKKTSWELRASSEWKSFPRTWIRFLGISTEIRRKSQRSLVALRRNLLSRCYSQIATHHHHIQQPPKKINHAHFIAGQDDHSHSELAWSTTVIFLSKFADNLLFPFLCSPPPVLQLLDNNLHYNKKKKGKLRKSSLL